MENKLITDFDIYNDLSATDIQLVEESKQTGICNPKILPEYIYLAFIDGNAPLIYKLQKDLLKLSRMGDYEYCNTDEICSKDYLYQFYSLAPISSCGELNLLPYASCNEDHEILLIPEICIDKTFSIQVADKIFTPFVKIKNEEQENFAYISSQEDGFKDINLKDTELYSKIYSSLEVKAIKI